MSRFLAIDLFCGAGGLSVGVERAGFEIVLANEIEPDFAESYRINHPATKVVCADIHSIDFEREADTLNCTERIDLLCGGPPCQGFSTVGKKDRQDPRNSLFWEFLRAVRQLSPRYVLFENVSGFKRLYDGKVHEHLTDELREMGYMTHSQVLEACDFGLPQKRLRTIVVAWKANLRKVVFPQPSHGSGHDLFGLKPRLTLMDAIGDLPPLGAGQASHSYLSEPLNEYQATLRGACTLLTEHNVANYGPKMRKILDLVPPGGSILNLPLELRPAKYFNNTYARLLPDAPCPTITRNFGTPSSSRCIHPFQNRALSTREGARLQGFPDNYIFTGSKTSKNLQIGNAVPPVFGEVVALEIARSLAQGKNTRSRTA